MQLKGRPKASARIVKNVKTWLGNSNNPIHPKEIEFLDSSDLISFCRIEKSSLRGWIESHVLYQTKALWGLVSPRNWQPDMADEGAIEWDDAAVDRLGRIAIIFIAVVIDRKSVV